MVKTKGCGSPKLLLPCVWSLYMSDLEDRSNGLMSFHFPSLTNNIWQLFVSLLFIWLPNSPSTYGPFFSFLLFFPLVLCTTHTTRIQAYFLILKLKLEGKYSSLACLLCSVFFSRKDTFWLIILFWSMR